ncbi:MAG: DUF4304 domain-containing protein [Chromatiales bacterium]|jgi:hypothetical protein
MNQTKKTRTILKRALVPHVESEGFVGKFPEFHRTENGELHLLSVQFDKYGGGFFLEFARHPSGHMATPWDEMVPERELTVAHSPIESRARLQQDGHQNSLSEDWFRFEDLPANELEDLVLHVISLFPQVNDWLREGRAGPDISAK